MCIRDRDHVELYYQHRVDPKTPVEEVAGTMADLIREGKILHWGISEADESIIRKAHRVCPVSYTHLDVYKRQILSLARYAPGLNVKCPPEMNFSPCFELTAPAFPEKAPPKTSNVPPTFNAFPWFAAVSLS